MCLYHYNYTWTHQNAHISRPREELYRVRNKFKTYGAHTRLGGVGYIKPSSYTDIYVLHNLRDDVDSIELSRILNPIISQRVLR